MIEWQLVCDALKFCSPAGEVPTAEPTVFVPPTPACAGVDDRAQDCGAANTARPQSCCAGLVCGEGASVRCVDPSDAPPPLKLRLLPPNQPPLRRMIWLTSPLRL